MRGRRLDDDGPIESVDAPPGRSSAGTRGGVTTLQRRPDESMSLLTDLYASTLDDEYHVKAARQRRSPDTSSADVGAGARPSVLLRQPAVVLGIGVLVIGMLLATTVIDQRREAPTLAAERQSLIERIDGVSARAATLRDDVVSARTELGDVQEQALQTTALGESVSADLERLATISGEDAVTGPGLVIQVDDAPPGTVEPDDSVDAQDGRIQDIDLQQLINGLWEAGAEAISVDGTRVGARSAVRAAGDALFMDLHPMAAPYEIVAIGDPDDLGARFLDTYGADWFQVLSSLYGVEYEVESRESVRLPAATGTDLMWAETLQEQNE